MGWGNEPRPRTAQSREQLPSSRGFCRENFGAPGSRFLPVPALANLAPSTPRSRTLVPSPGSSTHPFRFPPRLWLSEDSHRDTKLLYVLAVPLRPSAPPTRNAALEEASDVIRLEEGAAVGQVPAAGDGECGRAPDPEGAEASASKRQTRTRPPGPKSLASHPVAKQLWTESFSLSALVSFSLK